MRIEKPCRKKQTATIQLNRAPDDVFALMCPVREHEWIPCWKTTSIHSVSGVVEQDCIFTTFTDGKEATWITTAHDPGARLLTIYKIIPGELITRLDITVDDVAPGCAATIAYEHTALSAAGAKIVDQHAAERYGAMMDSWKEMIHCYLGEDTARLAS